MSFIDFLLENYLWILIILGVAIVTIIGFLADLRSKKKKKSATLEGEVNNVEPSPIQTQSINQVTESTLNNMNTSLSNAIPKMEEMSVPTEIKRVPVENPVVEPIISTNTTEVYHALADQTPHFEPRNIDIPQMTATMPIQHESIAPMQMDNQMLQNKVMPQAPQVNNMNAQNVVRQQPTPYPNQGMPTEVITPQPMPYNNSVNPSIVPLPIANQVSNTTMPEQIISQPNVATPNVNPGVVMPSSQNVTPLEGATFVVGNQTVTTQIPSEQIVNKPATNPTGEQQLNQTSGNIINDEMWKL